MELPSGIAKADNPSVTRTYPGALPTWSTWTRLGTDVPSVLSGTVRVVWYRPCCRPFVHQSRVLCLP
eukprot:2602359-Prymnesium_polylepis.1